LLIDYEASFFSVELLPREFGECETGYCVSLKLDFSWHLFFSSFCCPVLVEIFLVSEDCLPYEPGTGLIGEGKPDVERQVSTRVSVPVEKDNGSGFFVVEVVHVNEVDPRGYRFGSNPVIREGFSEVVADLWDHFGDSSDTVGGGGDPVVTEKK
jgi:hypothetical protein